MTPRSSTGRLGDDLQALLHASATTWGVAGWIALLLIVGYAALI